MDYDLPEGSEFLLARFERVLGEAMRRERELDAREEERRRRECEQAVWRTLSKARGFRVVLVRTRVKSIQQDPIREWEMP